MASRPVTARMVVITTPPAAATSGWPSNTKGMVKAATIAASAEPASTQLCASGGGKTWKAIDCPTLLVQGRESDILDDAIAKRMIDAQPRAQLAVVAGAGHTVPGDQPDVFLRVLSEFLARA